MSEDQHLVHVLRRHDESLAKTVEGIGSHAYNTQIKALLMMASMVTLYRNQHKGITSEPIPDVEQEDIADYVDQQFLKTNVSMIKGINCIPCTIEPRIPMFYRRPQVAPTPGYILDMYQYLESRGYHGVLHNFNTSWISTGNVTGVVTALQSIIRVQTVTVASKQVYAALVRILYASGFRYSNRIEAPELDDVLLRAIEVPLNKKSGITLGMPQTFTYEGVRLCYSNTADKRRQLPVDLQRYRNIVADLWKEVLGGKEWAFDVFPIMLNKFAEKPEVRQEGEDKEKVRIFFLVSLLKFLMDSTVHIPFHHVLRRVYAYSIGHKWRGGGAEEFAREFNAHSDQWHYFWWDASKLDQSIVAFFLSVICMLSMIIYKPGSKSYIMLQNICAHCADNTSAKYVTWIGKYLRLIIGTVFSGDLNTSHIDTIMCMIMVEIWIMEVTADLKWKIHEKSSWVQTPQVASELKEMKLAVTLLTEMSKEDIMTRVRALKKGHPLHYRYVIYGDDGQMGVDRRLKKWLNIDALKKFAKEKFGITLKDKACGSSDRFFTDVYPDGSCNTNRPNFLKRYFVKVKFPFIDNGTVPVVMAFRPRSDYDVRLGRTGTSIEEPEIEVARLIGLLWDTMGTNKQAWDMISDAINFLLGRFPASLELLQDLARYSLEDLDERSPIYHKLKKLNGMTDYSKKVLDREFLDSKPAFDSNIRIPSWEEVIREFIPANIEKRFRDRWERIPRTLLTIVNS